MLSQKRTILNFSFGYKILSDSRRFLFIEEEKFKFLMSHFNMKNQIQRVETTIGAAADDWVICQRATNKQGGR